MSWIKTKPPFTSVSFRAWRMLLLQDRGSAPNLRHLIDAKSRNRGCRALKEPTWLADRSIAPIASNCVHQPTVVSKSRAKGAGKRFYKHDGARYLMRAR